MRRMSMRGRRGRGKATDLNLAFEFDCRVVKIDVQLPFSMHRAFELHRFSFAIINIRSTIHGSFYTFCSGAITNPFIINTSDESSQQASVAYDLVLMSFALLIDDVAYHDSYSFGGIYT